MTTRSTKTILFASVLETMVLVPFESSTVYADGTDKIAENERKIEEFRVQALTDGQVPTSKILDRLDSYWVEKYEDTTHFEKTEDAVHSFIERNKYSGNAWDEANALLHSEIQNFETITGAVGQGHVITLHIAELAKLEGKYEPTEPVRKYHEWIAITNTAPKEQNDITESLIKILGDAKYIDLARRHAENFNQLADNGSVPAELANVDTQYWIFIANVAQCELKSDCEVASMGDGQPATVEELAEIERTEHGADSMSGLSDFILPKAYAWTKVYVDYDLYAYLNTTSCYYNNCTESWDEDDQNGSGKIDVMNYDSPVEHAYRDAVMYFYGSACDTHSGPQDVINNVETTPYLGNQLRTQYMVDGLNINSCATASKTITATHNWIIGILVESSGSYYWVP